MRIKIIKKITREIKFFFQRIYKGFSDDETWTLKDTFIEWLYPRLKRYKELAPTKVDLSYHKFKYKEKEYTFLEMIDLLLEDLEYILNQDYVVYDKEQELTLDIVMNIMDSEDKANERIIEIYSIIFPYLWW